MKQYENKKFGIAGFAEKVDIAPRICTHYCGEMKTGRIKLLRDDVILYGIGSLYEVTSSRLVEGKRKVKLNATPIRTTPDYEPQLEGEEKRIACVGRKSGKEFRFVGRIVSRKRRTRSTKQNSPAVPVSNAGGKHATLAKMRKLAGELRLISGARAVGFDPSLKLAQVCAILQESRSSVYRKIACGIFPPQIKRGKGSFWLLSHIERYAGGDWVPTLESER